MTRRLTNIIALAALTLVASGCLVMTGSDVKESGTKITGSTLTQIEPGKTTEAWLVAAAGEPTSKRTVDDHTSILRYEHTVTSSKGGTILFIYAGGDQKKEMSSTLFEVTDGVVTRYWNES